MTPNKGASANRRPAGLLSGSGDLTAIVAADRAFPAAVAELCRWPAMRTCLSIALVSITCAACAPKHQNRPRSISEEFDYLYQSYLQGGVDDARHSLQDTIKLLESGAVSPKSQAHGLWLTYGRLFVLEERSEDVVAAEAALAKATFWCQRKAEFLECSSNEAAVYVQRFGRSEGLRSLVQTWDKNRTEGQGPRYAQQH